MATYMQNWSAAHQTSETITIAEAIHELAGGDAVEVERIRHLPTEEQLEAVWRWSTRGSKIGPSKLIWDKRPFTELKP